MKEYIIEEIKAMEILDSRGNPTVEVKAIVNGQEGIARIPSGASTGKYEAVELRDGDENRYGGKGVLKAVYNVNTVINEAFKEIFDVNKKDRVYITNLNDVDKVLILLDGTENKENLGANATLGVSIAVAKAMAKVDGVEFFEYLGGQRAYKMPVPMMNILNGGGHADNNVDIQEFMIMPIGATTFTEAVRMCAEVYHKLKEILVEKGLSTGVGDEGGFAPNLARDEEALDLILEAIDAAGFEAEKDFVLALDAAASEWKEGDKYILKGQEKEYTTDELIDYWEELIKEYPIYSLEDGLDEEDWEGWQKLNRRLGRKVQLVGDDLLVTNRKRLARGIEEKSANSILIKPNQIGTMSETLSTMNLALEKGWTTVVSHRSGETSDTTIADLAVALNTGQLKTGAPSRTERVAKYNRLMEIEQMLGDKAVYPGIACFNFYEK